MNWSTSKVLEIRGWCIVKRNSAKRICAIEVQRAEPGLANAGRLLQHGLKHGLKLTGRTTDNLENLRGRGLLLQRLGKVPTRLGELARARFELLFQLDQ